MTAFIGITASLDVSRRGEPANDRHTLKTQYADAITAVGGVSVILPLATKQTALETLKRLDGIILSGGPDIPPDAYGAQPHPKANYMHPRLWESDRLWYETARDLGAPILGICLGMQVINVVAGGTLLQDLPTQRSACGPHVGPGIGCQHGVIIEPGSWLDSVAPKPASSITVTSSHHQAVERVADGFRVTSRAPDGVIETIEAENGGFIVGVQWHPERCLDQPNWLLKGFVEKVEEIVSSRRA